MKISIIIPVYNVAPYIADCVQSVMRQTYAGDLECIFIDDCGTDDSLQIIQNLLREYTGNIDFKIVRHPHNRGLSAARNSGLSAATGDYVYFLDSDDEITPDCIELLAQPLRHERFDFVISDYRIVGSDRPKTPLRLDDAEVLKGDAVLHAYMRQEWYMMSVNKLYSLSFLNRHQIRFREGIINEDELWSFQIACLAKSMYVVKSETYLYKIREGSISVRKDSDKRCYSLNVILKEMCDFATAHGLQQNADVHNTIQIFRMISLYSINQESPALLRQFYGKQREMMSTRWTRCVRLNGLQIRKQLRDVHMVLPVSLAVVYLRLLFPHLN